MAASRTEPNFMCAILKLMLFPLNVFELNGDNCVEYCQVGVRIMYQTAIEHMSTMTCLNPISNLRFLLLLFPIILILNETIFCWGGKCPSSMLKIVNKFLIINSRLEIPLPLVPEFREGVKCGKVELPFLM